MYTYIHIIYHININFTTMTINIDSDIVIAIISTVTMTDCNPEAKTDVVPMKTASHIPHKLRETVTNHALREDQPVMWKFTHCLQM